MSLNHPTVAKVSNAMDIPEIINLIAHYLPLSDLARVCRVNRTWFLVASSHLWRSFEHLPYRMFRAEPTVIHTLKQSLVRNAGLIRQLQWPRFGFELFSLGPELTLLTLFDAPKLHPKNMDLILEVLRQNPFLEHLSLVGEFPWESVGKDQELFLAVGQLQQLRWLSIQKLRPVQHGLEYLLNRLPNLVTLETGLWGCPVEPLHFSSDSSPSALTFPVDLVDRAEKNQEVATGLVQGPLALKQLVLSDFYFDLYLNRSIHLVIEAAPLLESLSLRDTTGHLHERYYSASEALSRSLYLAGSHSHRLRELLLIRLSMESSQLEQLLSFTPDSLDSPSSPLTVAVWYTLTVLEIEDTLMASEAIFDVLIIGASTLKVTLEVLKISHINPRWLPVASVKIAYVVQHFSKLRQLVLKQGVVRIQDLQMAFLTPPPEGRTDPDDRVPMTSVYDAPGKLGTVLRWVPLACRETLEVLDVKIEGPNAYWCPAKVVSYYNDDYYVFPINHYKANFDKDSLEALEANYPIYLGALLELNDMPRLDWGESKFI